MIYVTIGTMYLDFPRLIVKMDSIAQRSGEKVVIQTGLSKTVPQHCEPFDFRPREEVLALQRDARLIICHGGIGSIIDALRCARPLLVVPRLKRHGEHNDDHQLDLSKAVERRHWGRIILDIDELDEACANPPPAYEGYAPARQALIDTVRGAIEEAPLKRGP